MLFEPADRSLGWKKVPRSCWQSQVQSGESPPISPSFDERDRGIALS